jgi:hypothetical protein
MKKQAAVQIDGRCFVFHLRLRDRCQKNFCFSFSTTALSKQIVHVPKARLLLPEQIVSTG